MSQSLTILDKQFVPFIGEQKIAGAVKDLAAVINSELKNEFPLFLAVLNGSFMFASDLLKQIHIPCEISFIKVGSYNGTSNAGGLTELIGLTEDLHNRTVVIVEDIVDSGNTLQYVCEELKKRKVKQIKVATILMKPGSYVKNIPINYVGFEIGNEFVIGYGLDYKGQGRNLKEIHVIA